MVSRDTLRKHADLDYQRLHSMHQAREECALETPRLQTPALPESAYKTSAVFKTPLYDGARITVGEYIFLEFRKFVSHPSFAKRTVSDNFRDDRDFKLPKPNYGPSSFATAKSMIKEFLVPLETYHVCPNDCIIFRGNYKDLEELSNVKRNVSSQGRSLRECSSTFHLHPGLQGCT